MNRGFLNRPKKRPSSVTDEPSSDNSVKGPETLPSLPWQGGPRTRVISKNPHIIQADYDLPSGPCYLYVPQGENTAVIIDSLVSLIAISKWKVWSTVLPVIDSPAYEIRMIEGKGMGMVAKRKIGAGELLVNERPIYSQRQVLTGASDYTYLNGYFYLGALEGLSTKSKEAIYALKNSYGPDYHQLPGILRTNFLIHDITEKPDPAIEFSGIFPLISRANHSCTPSANYFFSFSTFAGGLRAVRDIEVGEEISIQYTHLLMTRFHRQASLKENYFFTCSCDACSMDTVAAEASDTRRVKLGQIIQDLEAGSISPSLHELKEAMKAAEQEGLVGHQAQLLYYGAFKVMLQGKVQLGMEWLKRAKKLYLNIEGERSPTYKRICTVVP